MFQCVADASSLNQSGSPYIVCTRQCAFGNGGCSSTQICVDRPFCINCDNRNDTVALEGACLNTAYGNSGGRGVASGEGGMRAKMDAVLGGCGFLSERGGVRVWVWF